MKIIVNKGEVYIKEPEDKDNISLLTDGEICCDYDCTPDLADFFTEIYAYADTEKELKK